MTALKNPQPKLSIMYREHKELLQKLAPNEKTRIICCGAKLINQFGRWQNWKKAHYPSDWIYQTLDGIRHELLDEHSKHVIRAAIALLKELKFLSVRQNSRCENGRNGQDRTYQYKLHTDRIEAALESLYQPQQVVEKAGNADESSSFNVEFSTFTPELSKFTSELSKNTVESHTQITYTNNSTNPFTLKSESEKIEKGINQDTEGNQGEEDYWGHNDKQDKLKKGYFDNNKSFPQDKCSAVPLALNCAKVTQSNVTPLPQRKVNYFASPEEKEGFYRALLQLGQHKSGVYSAPGWASSIIKGIEEGIPCIYLQEFRQGLAVGSCELREWELTPGEPFPELVNYLKRRLMGWGMTPEQAITEAFKQLRDAKVGAKLWESFKLEVLNRNEEWQKQRRLGVSSAYLPPELLPQPEVPVVPVAQALQELQMGCVQMKGLATQVQVSLPAGDEVEELPALEPGEEAAAEFPAGEEEPEPMTLMDLQEKLNSRFASAARMMIRQFPSWGYELDEGLNLVLSADGKAPPVEYLQWLLENNQTRNRAITLINKHPEWGYSIDDEDQLSDW